MGINKVYSQTLFDLTNFINKNEGIRIQITAFTTNITDWMFSNGSISI